MIIKRIPGATRVCGQSQGFLGLPLRDETINDSVLGICNSMVSAWEPTPEELEKIKAGASIHVRIVGVTPPPMMVEVGEPPAEHS